MIYIIVLIFIAFFIAKAVLNNLLPPQIISSLTIFLSLCVFTTIFILSHLRISNTMIIEIQEYASSTIFNPVYRILIFIRYFLKVYIQTFAIMFLIFILFYIAYQLIYVQCDRPINWELYRRFWILYIVGGIEAVCWLLIGGKFKEGEETKHWIKYIKSNTFPSDCFKFIDIRHIDLHYLPFSAGILMSIFYCITMFFKTHDSQSVIHKFKLGISAIVLITVCIYFIQFYMTI